MKKLLIMIGLIGSVYGSEVTLTSFTFNEEGTCTLDENTSYNWGMAVATRYIGASQKVIIPSSTTFTIPSGKRLYFEGTIENYGNFISSGALNPVGSTPKVINHAYEGNFVIENEICVDDFDCYRFTFEGPLTNNGEIWNRMSGDGSSIVFSGTGGLTNTGSIYSWGSNTSITISEGTTIRNKGGSIFMSNSSNTSLILDGTLILEKEEEGKYPGFNTECMVMEEDEHMQDMIEAGMPEEEILRMFDRNGDGKIENYSTYMVISGSGTIDMSSLRDADMTLEDHYSLSTTQGCINIPKETFSTTTPFTGTIKLPYNTTCKNLDLSNATSISQLYYDGKLLDKGTLWVNTAGRIVKSIAGNIDLSVYNITLPPKYIDLSKALDLHEVIVSEYNTEENTSKYYLVTNDLGSDVFDTGTSAYNIYFDLQGTKPIDFVGRGILNFYGDNRGYMPTHPSSIYPKVNFKGDNSVFPGVTVFKDATFEDGITIPAGATVIPQNALDLTNLNVKGHLVI